MKIKIVKMTVLFICYFTILKFYIKSAILKLQQR